MAGMVDQYARKVTAPGVRRRLGRVIWRDNRLYLAVVGNDRRTVTYHVFNDAPEPTDEGAGRWVSGDVRWEAARCGCGFPGVVKSQAGRLVAQVDGFVAAGTVVPLAAVQPQTA